MRPERDLAIDLERFGRTMLLVGLAAAVVCVLGFFYDPQLLFRSYLWAFIFWLNIPLGLLALLMLQHLVGGAWGAVLRGVLEGGARTIPFMAILFIPIALGIGSIYEWAHWTAEDIAHNHHLVHKAQYLNPPWYLIRAGIYFGVWSLLVTVLMRWSYVQQHGGNPRITRWLAKFSGAGMLLGGLSITFAAVDWAMSLEPMWFSTIYGLLFVSSDFVVGMAFAIVLTAYMMRYEPLGPVVRPSDFQDLGSLLLAFVIVWTYMSFSQFLIIWAGDIVEEVQWYLVRLRGGWGWLAAVLLVFHFVVPFFALLSKNIKRDPAWLARVAILVLFMQLLFVYWMVKPALGVAGVASSFFDLAALVAIGGVWLWIFSRQLRRQPAVLVFERSS